MRRRLKNFLPIVLIALVVQIFAPIGACWAAAIATSDPLAAAVICHGGGSTPGRADQTGNRAHEGSCSACSVLQTGAPVDAPKAAAVAIERPSGQITWHVFAAVFAGSRANSTAQARAPPPLS